MVALDTPAEAATSRQHITGSSTILPRLTPEMILDMTLQNLADALNRTRQHSRSHWWLRRREKMDQWGKPWYVSKRRLRSYERIGIIIADGGEANLLHLLERGMVTYEFLRNLAKWRGTPRIVRVRIDTALRQHDQLDGIDIDDPVVNLLTACLHPDEWGRTRVQTMIVEGIASGDIKAMFDNGNFGECAEKVRADLIAWGHMNEEFEPVNYHDEFEVPTVKPRRRPSTRTRKPATTKSVPAAQTAPKPARKKRETVGAGV